MWLKMAIETFPGECRMNYRADQQHPGHEINSVCGEPGEATLAANGAMGMPAGSCACCAGKSTDQESKSWAGAAVGERTDTEERSPGQAALGAVP